MLEGLFHCNVNVTDLDRSLPFYQMLGFNIIVDFREGMSSPELAKALGMEESKLRGVHLSVEPENTSKTRIDLVEFQQPKTEGKPYPHLHHTGINRISIRTTNLQQTYQDLQSRINFLSEPVTLPGTNFTFVCFKDPDGTVLQFVEGEL